MRKQQFTYIAPKLHPGQVRMFNTIVKSNKMFNTIVTSRQFGKSFLLIQLVLYYCFKKPGIKCMITSLTNTHTSQILKDIVEGLEGSGLIQKYYGNIRTLRFCNGSEIAFRSITRSEYIRGNNADKVFCDEAAYYKDDIFDNDISALMNTKKNPQAFFFSSPRGKNWFYKNYQLGIDENEENYLTLKGHWTENPMSNKALIESRKLTMPEMIYRQEYEGEFIDDTGSVFMNINNVELIEKWEEPSGARQYFVGIDLAIKNDYTVVTVVDDLGNIVYCYKDTKKPKEFINNNIKDILNKYNPVQTLVEDNGIGAGWYEDIEKMHRSVVNFHTSNSSKDNIVQELCFAFEEMQVKIPKRSFYSEYYNELIDFGFILNTKSRTYKLAALTGHDDHVISLSLANHARMNGGSSNSFAFIKKR